MWHDQKFFVIQKLLKDQEGELLDFGARDQILKNSPDENEDFFVVPKVVE